MTNYSNITTDIIDLKEGVLNILGGLLLFSFDFLAAMFIIAREKLRTQKEYINYFGILIYDSLFGLAFVLSWAHNISLYLNEDCKFDVKSMREG